MSFITLPIILIFISLILTIWNSFSKEGSKFKIYLVIFILIIATTLEIYQNYKAQKTEKEVSIEGKLHSDIDYEPEYITVYYGNNTFVYPANKIKNKPFTVPLQIGDTPNKVVFEFSSKGLLLTTEVRSIDFKIIASVENNNWKVNPGNYFERNYDDTAFEVIDTYGNPVLQVEVFNNEKIRIHGVFVSKNSVRIVSERGMIERRININDFNIQKLLSLVNEANIKKWFKYGKNTLGERTEFGKNLKRKHEINLSLRKIALNEYSVYTNSNLSKTIEDYVSLIRNLYFGYEQKRRINNLIQIKNSNKGVYDSLNIIKDDIIHFYEDSLKSPISLLRNEIIRRSPRTEKPPAKFLLFEDPTNINGIKEIVDYFELLLRSFEYQYYSILELRQETGDLTNQINNFMRYYKKEKDKISNIYYSLLLRNRKGEKENQLFQQIEYIKESISISKEFEYQSKFSIKILALKKEINKRITVENRNKYKFNYPDTFILNSANDFLLEEVVQYLNKISRALDEN